MLFQKKKGKQLGKMNDTNKEEESVLISKFLEKFIVPNFYRKEHFFAMKDWSDEKVANFKQYLEYRMCSDDSVVEIVNGLIVDFEEKEEEEEESK